MVCVEADTGAEWRLEEVLVGRGGGAPLQGLQEGREDLGIVRAGTADLRPRVVVQLVRPDLGIEQEIDAFALGVVIDAGKASEPMPGVELVQPFDQPPPVPRFDEVTNANFQKCASRMRSGRFPIGPPA